MRDRYYNTIVVALVVMVAMFGGYVLGVAIEDFGLSILASMIWGYAVGAVGAAKFIRYPWS